MDFALTREQEAIREGATFVVPGGRRAPAREVLALIAAGALAGNERACRDWRRRGTHAARDSGRSW